jgi:nucleolar protein 56
MAVNFVLYELASGYALFEHKQSDEIAHSSAQFQKSIQDLGLFGQMISLVSFLPFKSAADALQQINDISEGLCNDTLKAFLEMNLPANKRGKGALLGVSEKNLAGNIKAMTGIQCESSEFVHELTRGIRQHIHKMIKQLDGGNSEKAQLGLGHGYSRSKVKFNVNRSDVMVTQAICLLDLLDKDINTFAMRVREWYSWHFPELVKIVSDNAKYAQLVQTILNRNSLSEASLPQIEAIVDGDSSIAKQILDASRASMGTDIGELDLLNIQTFAKRVISLAQYRQELQGYLHGKMMHVAPNLATLIGDVVGARLISHAGSLTNLSKYPASTVQILGAEKALFRALKTQGNTPKYGLIYHSSFIGRAGHKNKGRISRYLANKCSIASRIDCFLDKPTSKFGEALKQQVEDRLRFYETGEAVKPNTDVMKSVMDDLSDDEPVVVVEEPVVPVVVEETVKKAKKEKRKHQDDDSAEKPKKKKKKHDKHHK